MHQIPTKACRAFTHQLIICISLKCRQWWTYPNTLSHIKPIRKYAIRCRDDDAHSAILITEQHHLCVWCCEFRCHFYFYYFHIRFQPFRLPGIQIMKHKQRFISMAVYNNKDYEKLKLILLQSLSLTICQQSNNGPVTILHSLENWTVHLTRSRPDFHRVIPALTQ